MCLSSHTQKNQINYEQKISDLQKVFYGGL